MPTDKSRIRVIFLTVLIDLIGFGIVLPILPYFAQRLGAGGLELGLLMGAFSGMQFLSTAILGRLSDSVGRRPILLVTMVINAAGYILFALAGSFPLLLFARLIGGAASGNISVAQAYMADISAPADRSRAMGMLGAAFGIGFVLGPAIGGLAGHEWGPMGPGLVAAALSILNLALAWRILPESLKPELRKRHKLLDFGHIGDALAKPQMKALLVVWAVVPFTFTGFTAIMPLHAGAAFGWQEKELGFSFAVIGLVAAIVQGWAFGKLAARYGDRALLVVGTFAMAVSIAMIPLLPSGLAVILWMAPLAAANSLFSPAATGMVSILADASEQGTILGAAQALAALGRFAGPGFYGEIYDVGGATLGYLAVGALMLLGGAAATRVPRGAVLHQDAPVTAA